MAIFATVLGLLHSIHSSIVTVIYLKSTYRLEITRSFSIAKLINYADGTTYTVLQLLMLQILLEHKSRGRVPLISHPYDDSSTVYLGTAILTIFFFLHLLNTEEIQ
jgi:hypothetical protein